MRQETRKRHANSPPGRSEQRRGTLSSFHAKRKKWVERREIVANSYIEVDGLFERDSDAALGLDAKAHRSERAFIRTVHKSDASPSHPGTASLNRMVSL